jgi:hypothetical protein
MNLKMMVCVLVVAALAAGPAMAGQKPKANAAPAAAQAQSNPDGQAEESKVKRGFEIAPVPLDLTGKNRALVGLGSYIVNAQGGCNDCHTWPNYAPGGNPYFGQPLAINANNYLAGGRPFGPFVSRNLTPDPASPMTREERYQEFVSIMRTGIDPDALHPQFGPFLQVMPWPVYRDMTDRDLRAIFEYLSSIPHADPYCTASNPDPICKP